MNLKERILDKSARVGVIGLGYVGLPLATELARVGFHVTGVDVDAEKVRQLNAGVSYIPDVSTDDVAAFVKAGRLACSTDSQVLGTLDVIDVCVPTPLR